jgi:hypothetical protein
MRNNYYLLILILITNGLNAQVYTPLGKSVEYQTVSAGDIALFEYQAANYISNRKWTNFVTKTGDATGEYNCHSYAWYKSEGEAVRAIIGLTHFWIGIYM